MSRDLGRVFLEAAGSGRPSVQAARRKLADLIERAQRREIPAGSRPALSSLDPTGARGKMLALVERLAATEAA